MKRFLISLIMIAGLLMPTFAYAQTSPATSSSVSPSQVMSPEDMAKMREQLAELSKAMGNPLPAPATSAKTESDKPVKSIGDVADKALDMMGQAVATLSNSLSKIAPHVWRIMIVQQYAKAIDDILTPVMLLVLLSVVTIVIRKNVSSPPPSNERWDDSDWGAFWFRTIIPVALMCIFGIWFVADLGDSIKLLINPEYYAIKDILLMLTNPSAVNL